MNTDNPVIYFDNAAAARPVPELLDFFRETAGNCYANQEAVHNMAYTIRHKMDQAAREMSKALCGKVEHVHWSDSGTGAFSQLADFPEFKNGNIITTQLEHPALLAALRRTGAELRFVRCPKGIIDADHLSELLDNETILVAFHHVQSETGIIQPLENFNDIIKSQAPQAMFMADTIQSAGKLKLPWKKAQLDIIAVSGHKLGAPGGAALIIRKSDKPSATKLIKYLEDCRSKFYTAGRPDPAIALTAAESVKLAVKKMPDTISNASAINSFLRNSLKDLAGPGNQKITFTTDHNNASPYILHFIIPGLQSAILVRMLSEKNIHCAAGSACQAESGGPSKVLTAMGFKRNDAYSGMRLSFWQSNSMQDAELFMEAVKQVIKDY
jgi:cysteine desulfurase